MAVWRFPPEVEGVLFFSTFVWFAWGRLTATFEGALARLNRRLALRGQDFQTAIWHQSGAHQEAYLHFKVLCAAVRFQAAPCLHLRARFESEWL